MVRRIRHGDILGFLINVIIHGYKPGGFLGCGEGIRIVWGVFRSLTCSDGIVGRGVKMLQPSLGKKLLASLALPTLKVVPVIAGLVWG